MVIIGVTNGSLGGCQLGLQFLHFRIRYFQCPGMVAGKGSVFGIQGGHPGVDRGEAGPARPHRSVESTLQLYCESPSRLLQIGLELRRRKGKHCIRYLSTPRLAIVEAEAHLVACGREQTGDPIH